MSSYIIPTGLYSNSGGAGSQSQVPVFTNLPIKSPILGVSYEYKLEISGEAPFTFSAITLPDGLSFDETTHIIGGTPTTAGSFSGSITCQNSYGSTTATLTGSVVAPPSLMSAPTLPENSYTNRNFAIDTEDFGWSLRGTFPISYSIISGTFPDGLEIAMNVTSSMTGFSIIGMPTTVGEYPFTIEFSNEGGSVTSTCTISVKDPAPIFISSTTLEDMTTSSYTTQIRARGWSPPSIYISPNYTLPTGLTFNFDANDMEGNAWGTLTGENVPAGNYVIPIRVSNNIEVKEENFSLSVYYPPVIGAPSSLGNGTVGVAYSVELLLSGEEPLALNVTKGSYPDGLDITVEGTPSSMKYYLSGTPTTAGQYSFTLTLSNSYGEVSKDFTLEIVGSANYYVLQDSIDNVPSGAQTIWDESLPDANWDDSKIWVE